MHVMHILQLCKMHVVEAKSYYALSLCGTYMWGCLWQKENWGEKQAAWIKVVYEKTLK